MIVEKPVPTLTDDNREFWLNCSRNKLILQRCSECATTQYYPRAICTNCGSKNLEWVESAGKGIVYSYTVIHRAPSPAFDKYVPYVLAIIQLNEGPKMMSNIVACDPNDIRIGMEVEVDFEKRAGEVGIPVFKLIKRG